MESLDQLFANNAKWAADIKQRDPDFFARLTEQQNPDYLWIGCADSRVPANDIVGLRPGELFVHRNIANCVVHTDLNCLSVLHYAIDKLKVKHIIVCGHYGCGGVHAALSDKQQGLSDHWIGNIRDVYFNHRQEIDAMADERQKLHRLCELNVTQQVANVSYIPAVQNAWAKGRPLTLHGWIYSLRDGLLKSLTTPISGPENLPRPYRLTP